MFTDLPYFALKTPGKTTAHLKRHCEDFIVKEDLGYEMSGEGEFVALKVRKTNANTLFVGEKLAQFAGISARNMSYAGLKDRRAVTEQWFCLQMPGKATPDFSQFQQDGVEILAVTRHHRKIRVGSLQGNFFEILLRGATQNAELDARLDWVKTRGFPNYFTEQRFGRDGHNLTQALRWARGEITVKDRKKRGFYLSSARSEIFNLVVAERLKCQVAEQILPNDIVQLAGSKSWFRADETEDLNTLQTRLESRDLVLTAPLIGEQVVESCELENAIVAQHQAFAALLKQERVNAARRAVLMLPQDFSWQYDAEGLRLRFYLPAGSYATALVRELVQLQEEQE